MKFSELHIRNGMVAKLRNGSMTVFMLDEYDTLLYLGCLNARSFEEFYDDDGKAFDRRYDGCDIMAVYKSAKFNGNTIDLGKPIWERPIDWSAVEIDTPVLVSSSGNEWMKRHFSHLENGDVYVFDDGATSWTSCGRRSRWKYTKLAK